MRMFVLLCALLALTACAPKTPPEVAGDFWRAVIASDANGAVESSTLGDARDFDGFSHNWTGFKPTWGKTSVEGEHASTATTLSKTTRDGAKTIEFDTILIKRQGQWKVDYAATGKEVRSAPYARLFDQLERLGKSISEQFSDASAQFAAEMERMQRELADLSRSVGDQAAEIVEQQAEALRSTLEELADSIRRALREHEKSLSDDDREILREVSDDLDQQREALLQPTVASIADGGRSVADANQRLDAIHDDTLTPYKKQWQAWSRQTEEDMKRFMADISTMAGE